MKTIIANWKMELGVRESVALARGVLRGLRGMQDVPNILVAPTFPALFEVSKVLGRSRVQLAAQTVHTEEQGAYTGSVSAKVLKEVGVQAVILGHSETRAMGETDEDVHQKVDLALRHGLHVIVAVGESMATREAGETEGFIHDQIKTIFTGIHPTKRHTIYVAYEPLWAIGSGKVPSIQDVSSVHTAIKQQLDELDILDVSVLYGGSVIPENAYEFLNHSSVDGVLVGGASVRIKSLMELIHLASELS
ncbi:TPA: triose-phosphate isomerase [Candidatus Uhrbacteria bacterium]|nr:triose-phosphate isomerase [Candidatus Uhrbacteria bacterium]